MERCEFCGELLLVEHDGPPGTDRPAGERNTHLVARCPNPRCPSNGATQPTGSGEPSGEATEQL